MATGISAFYPGTSKRFTLTFNLNGETPDISADTVTWRVKTHMTDTDAEAVLTIAADVATSGADGIAIFTATPAETNIVPGQYYSDVEWQRAGGDVYVVATQIITVNERVSDAA
ncbi:MAG: hypothetical protein JW910_09370 [Anaerolineae bacterium]|nr:hypothetical protein [Anaerolineae bacterium]